MQVKTTFVTDGASCRNTQLHDLPQQVEDALSGIAREEAIRYNDFAVKYIGSLEERGQVIHPFFCFANNCAATVLTWMQGRPQRAIAGQNVLRPSSAGHLQDCRCDRSSQPVNICCSTFLSYGTLLIPICVHGEAHLTG